MSLSIWTTLSFTSTVVSSMVDIVVSTPLRVSCTSFNLSSTPEASSPPPPLSPSSVATPPTKGLDARLAGCVGRGVWAAATPAGDRL